MNTIINIDNVSKIDNYTLKKIICFWDNYNSDEVLLSYFELKKRKKFDIIDEKNLQSIFFNFEEINNLISPLFKKNKPISYSSLLSTVNYLNNIKIHLN